MTKFRVLIVLALVSISSLGFAQDAVKRGSQGWTDLEKQLADINDQWVCAHKYHKNHAQDCVDFKNKIWPDTFFEISNAGGSYRQARNGQETDCDSHGLGLFLLAMPDRIRKTSS